LAFSNPEPQAARLKLEQVERDKGPFADALRRWREGIRLWDRFLSGDLFPKANERTQALQTLGLPAGATAEQIQEAYQRLAQQTHPDKGGTAEDFVRVDAAYRLLVGK